MLNLAQRACNRTGNYFTDMDKPKTVILVANAAFTIINFRKELIAQFLQSGYQVIVVCPSACALLEEQDVSSHFERLGATHLSIPLTRSGINPFSEIKLFVSLLRIIRRIKPDVVLNYTIKPTIYGSIAAAFSPKTRIFSTITGLGYLFTSKSLKSKLLGLVVKMQYYFALKMNTLVFFQNNDDLQLFTEMGLLRRVATKIVNGSGVDLTAYKPSTEQKRNNSFIMVGRILKDKGIDEYIAAARLVKKNHPEALFQVLGPLDNNPAAYGMVDIESWQKEGCIEYIPPQKDVRPYLAKSQVFVLPSYREGTPRSTLEAMAMGMPVITTDAPGCKETIIDTVNGYQVPTRDHVGLAAAMEKFIVDGSLSVKMGEESLKMARNKFDVHKVNESILAEIIS